MGFRPIILIPFTLYKATRLNLFGLSEPVPIGLGVIVGKKGDPVAAIGFACSSSCLCHRRQRLCRAQGPHFAKALVGPRNQVFLPLAILIRAWLLLVADTIGRNILEPKDIPAGIMIALIGAPYLLLLMKSRRKSIIFVKAEDVFSFFCLLYHLQISGAAQIGT